MSEIGKLLLIVGLVIAAIGAVIWSGFGREWFGKLPGDIHVQKGNFNFYFPIVTSLLLSVILTLVLWFFRK